MLCWTLLIFKTLGLGGCEAETLTVSFDKPMHRTQSLDYACVSAGEIVLVLDGGEEAVIRPGECIVQRGTSHSWVNKGEGVCRILFVMVGSEKVKLESGEVLEETVFKK